MDRNHGIGSIRPPISVGRLVALMPASRAPAFVVTQLELRSSACHPLLGTDGLGGRDFVPVRAEPGPVVTVP